MASRLTALPPGLRQAVFHHLQPSLLRQPRTSFLWTRSIHETTNNPLRRPWNTRRLMWTLPVAGGLVLYLLPKPESVFPALLASPTIIPCNEERTPFPEPIINSPYEPKRSIVTLVFGLFRDKILEPLLTARRFIHLLWLFLPVLFTAPMLLIGDPERALGGDRWGAVWWYGFLTAQMQRAGPTFVKVCRVPSSSCDDLLKKIQLAQWAASRADLFPALLCERLGALHSRGKAHSLSHTKRVIERIFERPFDEVFEEFDETPIGTGAIAQVCYLHLSANITL